MSPKLVNINGKDYIKTGEDLEEVKPVATDETPAEETVEEPVVAGDEAIDDAAEKAAEAIVSKLPLADLTKAIEALNANKETMTPEAKEILNGEISKKDIEKMTGREKIVKFFQAALHSDHTSLKALAEGVAADGGYLFPKFVGELKLGELLENPFKRTISSQALPVMA